jgi:UDP-N-acetylglucosamine/UDP-N-acetylgalactosamine diphosphorylase
MYPLPEHLRSELQKFNQMHIVQFWDELDDRQRHALVEDLESVDLALLQKLHNSPAEEVDWQALAAQAEPPTAIRVSDQQDPNLLRQARELGEEALRNGEVAVVIVAGGQGTRLGFSKPKGLFPIGPLSERTLFQVLFDQVKARVKRYGKALPVLLMTSPLTHDETQHYVREQEYFGLDESDVCLFCQGTMAAVDRDSGKLLLDQKHRLALSPDGHGGMVRALERSGTLNQLRERGIKYLYYCQIDNPLAQVASPELLGFHRLRESELTTQVVKKVGPLERVGNVVDIDGQLRIIEYSDLPEEAAQLLNDEGELKLWAGNIAIHVFNVDFLDRVKDSVQALPFHTALKKVPFVNEQGERVQCETPNGMKFERFIFDLLPAAKNALAVESEKNRSFAPVKNAPGSAADTPELAQKAMHDQALQMLLDAGVDCSAAGTVEINPLFAIDVDELRQRLDDKRPVTGDRYYV